MKHGFLRWRGASRRCAGASARRTSTAVLFALAFLASTIGFLDAPVLRHGLGRDGPTVGRPPAHGPAERPADGSSALDGDEDSTWSWRDRPLTRLSFSKRRRPPVRAEFEKQEIVLVDGTDLPRHWPDLFVSLVDALRGRVDLVVLVNDSFDEEEVRELIEEAGLPGDSLTLAAIEHDTMWLRDFGPVVTVDDQGRPVILDSQYGGADRRLDDEVPQRFAALLGLPLLSTALALEGGNLLANGDGICVTTADTFERNAHLGVEATVRAALLRHYGCDRLVVLEPLVGEETGHVDMFLTFPSPSVAVVGEYRPSDDAENAELLDRNADRLDGQSTRNGPLRVVRMPMPAHFDGVWRSYTNVLYANGAVLVPTYETSHPEDQRRAFRIFANLLPGWEVVGIEAEGLTSLGGALHCVTATVGPVGAKRRLARVRAIPALELLPVRPEPVIVPDVYGPLTPLGKRPGRAG